MHPQHLAIKDFTYTLPDERIAKYPLPERDLAKLLVYNKGVITESIYRDIAQYLPAQSILVFNNTKVIPARLFFENANGAKIEILCLEPAEGLDMARAMQQTATATWHCMIGKAGKWKEKLLHLDAAGLTITAEIVARTNTAFTVQFNWQPQTLTFAEVLDKAGMMPIPPYFRRESEAIDAQRYQTVYAQHKGSVAAPTAGLHFTENVFNSLKEKQVDTQYLTLHVGAGTFKPVKSELIGEHEMHAEVVEITPQTLQHLLNRIKEKQAGGKLAPIIAVGTTAMRSLESVYWLALQIMSNASIALNDLMVNQWEPYGEGKEIQSTEAIEALLTFMKINDLDTLTFKTQIMIAPGYRLKIADALITNFHQPNSTLLLLIAALLGDEWKRIYEYALANNFRFLSYGDGSLLMF